jgi:uncharacterized protein (DUF3084 family)
VFYKVLGQNGLKNKFFDLKNPSPNFLVTIMAGIWTKQKTCHLFFLFQKTLRQTICQSPHCKQNKLKPNHAGPNKNESGGFT